MMIDCALPKRLGGVAAPACGRPGRGAPAVQRRGSRAAPARAEERPAAAQASEASSEQPAAAPRAPEQPAPQAAGSLGPLAAAGAVGLGVAAFVLTRLSPGAVSLSTLERTALPLDSALQNERPTLVEFYASWCEVCRELAPTVYQVEEAYRGRVNFVMLNIENQKWAPEVAEYRVGGIPHFVFLDSQGRAEAAAVGRLPAQVLEGNVRALAEGQLPPFRGATGATSAVADARSSMQAPPAAVSPRSHS